MLSKKILECNFSIGFVLLIIKEPVLISVENLVEGDIPTWIRRFVKQTGRGINRFKMINQGDTVLLGISGGKDSLALALALSLRLKWLPITYNLKAVMINWREYAIDAEETQKLKDFFTVLNIPFEIINAHMFPEPFKNSFNCYLCSRNRRRILFEYAEKNNISKIALGHHLDDFTETSIMNLCFRGNFSTMKPVQDFFKGKIYILRPMCEVKESVIQKLVKECDLPVSVFNCPHKDTNIRSKIKPIIKQLSHIDKLTREHIFAAHNFNDDLFVKND